MDRVKIDRTPRTAPAFASWSPREQTAHRYLYNGVGLYYDHQRQLGNNHGLDNADGHHQCGVNIDRCDRCQFHGFRRWYRSINRYRHVC